MKVASTIKQIAFVGDHLPRQCGIATFTSDICEAIATEFPECQCIVGAVNDRPEAMTIRLEYDLRSTKRSSIRIVAQLTS